MDLSQIAIAQTMPENQFRFDKRAHEKSVLRTEKWHNAFWAFVRRRAAVRVATGRIAERPALLAGGSGTS